MRIVAFSDHLDRYNGGTKVYNLWTKLMRQNDIDAVMSTPNGSFPRWLCNHQPVIPRTRIKKKDILWTTWLNNSDLDKHEWYYMDCELKGTLLYRNKLDEFLKNGNLLGVATHSRYIQSWYMANYEIKPVLINEWSDKEIFYPKFDAVVGDRCGYIPEPEYSNQTHHVNALKSKGLELFQVSGDEAAVADKLRTCKYFLGLNDGKHPLWGEGCPRTQQEAMHSGCLLIAFDCLGNREYLYHGFTGFIANDIDEMIHYVNNLDTAQYEYVRKNSLNFIKHVFVENYKIDLIKRFFNVE